MCCWAAVGGWAGSGVGWGDTSLHPEPDLWVAEMTDGGPLRLKVMSKKSPPLSLGWGGRGRGRGGGDK